MSDAVYGAGLEAIQMSPGPVTGSLAFAEHDGLLFSTGYIGGRVALRGPLSETLVTLGIGVRLVGGTRHWLNEVTTGDCGIFMPGDDHDALYAPGSIYASVTLSFDRLEALAEDRGLIVDLRSLGGTGVHSRRLSDDAAAKLEEQYEALHAGRQTHESGVKVLGNRFLDMFIQHVGRQPRPSIGGTDPRGHARIVARARAYILEHLERPLSIDEIAHAAHASRRTLFRAFSQVFDETPQAYVRKLRLHRIRQDLASESERACTVALVANRWGIGQLGRFARWYRELFGENPSQTLAWRPNTPPV
ncbi:helix-turn-helix domain-containing protein [Methyloceanibacter sp.]|uniref:helix-turn-helix domain-containing protein n=1 Tax=Methyloceanibacter sp. TaxID=1965321 RepID=UPI002B719A2D|nr:helix-turn-helix domain-containing protein [Methyloceanibacter sp.]HML91225.1 helix-turn-helix domain-containing protein [Methyloceanibacter sp.]